jgi:UDP-N-acetylmuramate--L-alanine ligase
MVESTPHKERVHLVGIGGSGMCALARLLVDAGMMVSGSDAHENQPLEELRKAGVNILVGHDPTSIEGVDRVIVSPAIPNRNPELKAARAAGVRVQSRAEALAELVNVRKPVCIAGSHGKTTTTSMLACVFERNGLDPGYMIGGIARSLDRRNARLGAGPFVVEACEAFGALHHWIPDHCIVTNVDDEHAEHYGGLDKLHDAFREMLKRVSHDGVIAICGDDQRLAALCTEARRTAVTYGLGATNVIRGKIDSSDETGSSTTVFKGDEVLGRVNLQVPGEHNVRNALGVLAVAERFGIAFQNAAAALADFKGVDRRFQFVGEANGVRVFDDFAHHPSEITAVLTVARRAVRHGGRLIVVFEPQLHSRVRRLAQGFANSLLMADVLVVMPVYAAGESLLGASDDLLARALSASGAEYHRSATGEEASIAVLECVQDADVVVTLGTGAIVGVASSIMEKLRIKDRMRLSINETELSASRGPDISFPEGETLLSDFMKHALSAPNAAAAVCGSERLSYKELADRATALATRLIEKGIARDHVVAVQLGRSTNRVVAFLGIMMAGAIYLPVEPLLPDERRVFMLTDAGVRAVVTDTTGKPGSTDIVIESRSPHRCSLDQVPKEPGSPAGRDAAYIIYTSGTTGNPKGVVVEHSALLNYARAAPIQFDVRSTSRVSQLSAFGFDVAIGDTAMALSAGACVVIPDDTSAQPGSPLASFVEDQAITHLSLTPSALSSLPRRAFHKLTHIIVGGEQCPPDLAQRWMSDYRFYNAYGPTEATVWSTVEECHPGDEVTIGRPLPNVQAYILNEDRQVLARDLVGQLWIAGAGLARGYLHRPELNEERFRDLAIMGKTIRCYQTGDLARMSKDGRIHFLGRSDDQVKLRGFRIELGEVEVVLRRHPNVHDAIVDVRKSATGGPQLVAYLVPTCGEMPSQREIANFVSAWLPGYMLPSVFVQIDRIPLNFNRKRDRRALPDPPPLQLNSSTQAKAAKTTTEKALVELFRRELRVTDDFGVDHSLAELGIDSLQTANLFLAIETQFAIRLSSEAFSNEDTIQMLALFVDSARSKATDSGIVKCVEHDSIIRRQMGYLAAWTGSRLRTDSLICSHNVAGTRPALFWCFQGNSEHESLATCLGPDQPLHGMRSGYLIFRYTPANVRMLAGRYADEIVKLQPEGTLCIGGNCQGGIIAREIALELRSRGRVVKRLFLLGQAQFPQYDGQVTLVFGAESHLNPYRRMKDPDRIFTAAYGTSYSVSIISGNQDDSFISPNIESLAAVVATHLDTTYLYAPSVV